MTTGKTLSNWERENGRCWVAEIEKCAQSGFTWAEAADVFNVNRASLQQYCRRCGLTFPWQGNRSPVKREQLRRMSMGNQNGPKPKQYSYRGGQYTLVELSAFSSVSSTTIRFRLYKGWSVEKAVETPRLNMKSGLEGLGEQAAKAKRAQTNRAANAAHGSGTTGNMGRTECPSEHRPQHHCRSSA